MGFPTKNVHFGLFWGYPYFFGNPHIVGNVYHPKLETITLRVTPAMPPPPKEEDIGALLKGLLATTTIP